MLQNKRISRASRVTIETHNYIGTNELLVRFSDGTQQKNNQALRKGINENYYGRKKRKT